MCTQILIIVEQCHLIPSKGVDTSIIVVILFSSVSKLICSQLVEWLRALNKLSFPACYSFILHFMFFFFSILCFLFPRCVCHTNLNPSIFPILLSSTVTRFHLSTLWLLPFPSFPPSALTWLHLSTTNFPLPNPLLLIYLLRILFLLLLVFSLCLAQWWGVLPLHPVGTGGCLPAPLLYIFLSGLLLWPCHHMSLQPPSNPHAGAPSQPGPHQLPV